MAVYLGHSPEHATTVPIVLNTVTGLISPQYHVVFNDAFTTTKSLHTDQIPENWPELFKHSEVQILDADEAASYKLDPSWADPTLEPAPTHARTTINLWTSLSETSLRPPSWRRKCHRRSFHRSLLASQATRQFHVSC